MAQVFLPIFAGLIERNALLDDLRGGGDGDGDCSWPDNFATVTHCS